jgi:hypothetical protein
MLPSRLRLQCRSVHMPFPMTLADKYRIKAGELAALAKAQTDPFGKAEYEKLSMTYLRLAEQAASRREQTAKRGISAAFPEPA